MIFLFYEIHRPQTIILLVLSTFLNSFLIYLIWSHTKSNLGTYKQLMTYLSIYNIFYSFSLFIANPGLHSSGEHHYFVVFCDGYLTSFFSQQARDYCPGVICGIYCGSFVLLKIHFVYRYVHICNNKYVFIFEKLHWKLFWILYQVGQIAVWFFNTMGFLYMTDEKTELLRSTLPKEYGLNVDELGYSGMFYQFVRNGTPVINWEDVYGLSVVLLLNGFNCSCMLICGYLTYHGLQNTVMSTKTRKLQNQLFNSLVVLVGFSFMWFRTVSSKNTVLPLAMVYMPEFVLLIGPIVGFGVDSLGMLNELLIAMMPAIDPIILIYFIGDYRRAVQAMFCKRIRTGEINSHPHYMETETSQRPLPSTASNVCPHC